MGTELRLVISCCGLLFSASDGDCLLAIDFGHVESWGANDQELHLFIQLERKKVGFNLETDAGDEICKALLNHTGDQPVVGRKQSQMHDAPSQLGSVGFGSHSDGRRAPLRYFII